MNNFTFYTENAGEEKIMLRSLLTLYLRFGIRHEENKNKQGLV
jgi:hypothetical protein